MRGLLWMVLATSVVVTPCFVGADDSRVVIESLAPTILGDSGGGVDGELTSRRGAETEDERSSPTSQPGWASSFARSSSSSGGGGAGVGSGTGSGSDDPCPPDTRKSCDDLDSSLCKMIIDIADKLLGDRTGVGPIEPIVKPCEDAIKVTKKSRELLWLMCQTPHLLDTYRRACKDNELTFCPFCHPSPKPTTDVTQIAPY